MLNRKLEAFKLYLKENVCRSKEIKVGHSHPYSYRQLEKLEKQYHHESQSSYAHKSEEPPHSSDSNRDRCEKLIGFQEPSRDRVEELSGIYSFRKLEESGEQCHHEGQLSTIYKIEILQDNSEPNGGRCAQLKDFLVADSCRCRELKGCGEPDTDLWEELLNSEEPKTDLFEELLDSKEPNTDSWEELLDSKDPNTCSWEELLDSKEPNTELWEELLDSKDPITYSWEELLDSKEPNTDLWEELLYSKGPNADLCEEPLASKEYNTGLCEELLASKEPNMDLWEELLDSKELNIDSYEKLLTSKEPSIDSSKGQAEPIEQDIGSFEQLKDLCSKPNSNKFEEPEKFNTMESETTEKLKAENNSISDSCDLNQMLVRISQHRTFLAERIDPDSGLLDKLLALQVLPYTEYAEIKCKKPFHKRNAKLLDYILKKNKQAEFLDALKMTKQQHLVNYLASNGIFNPFNNGDWPLTDKQVLVFDLNREFFVKNLEIDDFINELLSKEVINECHKELIRSKATSFEKNETLIDILRRRSLGDYQKTITCLVQSKQGHIAEILQREAVVAEIHAKLNVPGGNVCETEKELVATITSLLADQTLREAEIIMKLVMQGLASVKIGQSIVNYICCDTMEDLKALREMFISGRLKDLIEKTYNELLENKRTVFVAITWTEDDYSRCQRFFGAIFPAAINRTKRLIISAMALGVAQINDSLYVLCREPSTLLIFENMDSRTHSKEIRLDVVKVPVDMATNRVDQCLYISDSGSCSIWRLATTGQQQIRPTKWLSSIGLPCTISMSADGFLLMAQWGPPCCLVKYSLDATLVCSVPLPVNVFNPLHSVETSTGNFVVVHTWKAAEEDGTKSGKGVCEVNRDGEIVRVFEPKDESEQPMDPRHLSLDSLGRVFLADYRGNRVLVFDSDLSKCLVLFTATDHGIHLPRRLHFAADTHQLIVAQHDGKVDVYGFSTTYSVTDNAEASMSPDDNQPLVESTADSDCRDDISASSLADTTESQIDPLKTTNQTVSGTTLDNLPFELLDLVLLNAVLSKLLDENHGQSDERILAQLQSVSVCWCQRIRRRKFKTALKRLLSDFYRRNRRRKAIVRNSRQYLAESIQLKSITGRLRSTDCLTDHQTRSINSSKCERNKREALSDAIRSLDANRYSALIDCLQQTHQRTVARALETGGVFLKAEVHIVDMANRHKVELQLVRELNRLRDKKTTRPLQLEKLVDQLESADIEILSSNLDHGIVVWIRCRTQETLRGMQETDECDRRLKLFSDLFTFLSAEGKLGVVNTRWVNICTTHCKKEMVTRHLVLSRAKRFQLQTAVFGITKLRDSFHFLCTDPSTIQVFQSSHPYGHQKEIRLDQVRMPSDIGANQTDNCLYIIDQHNSYVWKVDAEHSYRSLKWVPAFEPFSLSVTPSGSVLMARMGQPCSLYVYESDVMQPMRRDLPSEVINIKHVVETSCGTYVFSHLPRQSETWNICEMTQTGQIVRRLNPTNPSEQMHSPWHLALDSGDRVLVADFRNGQVILLDSELRWQDVLLRKTKDGIQDPTRVFVDREKKQLIVAQSITWSVKGTVDCFRMSHL